MLKELTKNVLITFQTIHCPRVAGELESDSVALERIREYDELPQEKDWNTSFPIDEVYNNY